MIQFYAPDIESNPVLPEGDSLHCVKVLRMQPGEQLEVIDGKGHAFTCRLLDANRKHAMVQIIEKRTQPLPWSYDLTIGVAPTKHLDRMEWLTEKLTEVGVNRLIPLLCDRSERRELKTERLEKIAVSAMKQSLKAVLPEIDEMTPVKRLIKECTAEQRFICYCDKNIERRTLAREIKPGADAIILIGPEGDFSPEEVDLALSHGFVPVTLGDNRLRTETAALYAASTIHIVNQLLITNY
ncbi:MAG: 16S rRNA (uracil(1498)-N(3))-methyltransferase [Bacteroides sp.]|nr:16S rRNA (uracil(1498)-N(3))-methyltransferase [Bacteroides sp.]MCM1379356.1 16S rRNA (uracil(1498)-N(3))-methyltransferase [Bacteroides sp.]MCM1445216.1 16S rRNA (uracil(1498)-N(3))-methyltransferase [Prevotella sp.]